MYTMSRRRDSIVNRTHLANEKQTKRGAVKFALNDQWQKPFWHLIVKTGESKEEYAVGKALLNLSVEPVMSSGEQIKLLKMSYNPNGGDSLKLLTVSRKNGLGINILWMINSSKAVASPFRNLDPLAQPFFRLWRWFSLTRFQVSGCWNPPFL